MQTSSQDAAAAQRALEQASGKLAQDIARSTAQGLRVRAQDLTDQANAERGLRESQAIIEERRLALEDNRRQRQEKMTFAGFVIVVVAAVVVLRPFTRAFARRLEGGARTPALGGSGTEESLKRMEHAIDAMAIEIERISEGQRFTTKLMSEREGARLTKESS